MTHAADDGASGQSGTEPDAPSRTAGTNETEESVEIEAFLQAGPNAGNRGNGLAFLAFVVVVGAGLFFHLSGSGAGSFQNRLDASLLSHAELTLATRRDGTDLTVAPSWPIALYERVRADILFYAALAGLAGYLWSRSARARAQRDAWLVHERLRQRVVDLEKRLARLEGGGDCAEATVPTIGDSDAGRQGGNS